MSKNSKKRTNYFDRALIRLNRKYGQDELVLSLKSEISSQNVQIGQLKSYIDELEDTIKDMRKALKMSPEEKYHYKREEAYKLILETNKNLTKHLKACRKDKEDLIIKLNKK